MNRNELVYLAGPLSADTKEEMVANYRRAAEWNDKLHQAGYAGYAVFNPILNSVGYEADLPGKMGWSDYMDQDIQIIEAVDTWDHFAVLPGWEKSKGARIEVAIMREFYGKEPIPVEQLVSDHVVEKPISTPELMYMKIPNINQTAGTGTSKPDLCWCGKRLDIIPKYDPLADSLSAHSSCPKHGDNWRKPLTDEESIAAHENIPISTTPLPEFMFVKGSEVGDTLENIEKQIKPPTPVCWCGKALKAVGVGDFIGDRQPCTMHYECPEHGQDYMDVMNLATAQVSAEDTAQVSPVQGIAAKDCFQLESYTIEYPILGIAISGKARSGKSTLADMLIERLGKPWHIESISDPIMIEWCEENKPEDYATKGPEWSLEMAKGVKEEIRQELIELGQRRREQDPLYWINRLSCIPNAIIPNCRFAAEYDYFRNRDFYMIRVEATPEIREARGCPDLNDPSECDLDSIDLHEWDFIVYNDLGFTVLGDQADLIVEAITRRINA